MLFSKNIIALYLATAILVSCSTPVSKTKDTVSLNYFKSDSSVVQNGGVKIISIKTPKGNFKVWTKQIGNNPRIKLLLLNGGPGLTHEYFECFENFLPAEGIEFIYYDQLGCGNSDDPKDTTL